MPDYRLYQLHPDSGHFTDVEDIPAADDAAAIREARQRGHNVPLELWSGGRKVTRLDPPPEGAAFRPPGAALG